MWLGINKDLPHKNSLRICKELASGPEEVWVRYTNADWKPLKWFLPNITTKSPLQIVLERLIAVQFVS
jgi:hypothetical protein